MLAHRSHSHDVTGIVKAVWRKMLILAKRAASQSLIAIAGEAGLNCCSSASIDFSISKHFKGLGLPSTRIIEGPDFTASLTHQAFNTKSLHKRF